MTPGSMPRVGARGKNLELLKLLYFKVFQEFIYGQPLFESSDTWTKGNLEGLLISDPDVHAPWWSQRSKSSSTFKNRVFKFSLMKPTKVDNRSVQQL